MISKTIKKILLVHLNEDPLPVKKLERVFSKLGPVCETVMLDLRDHLPLTLAEWTIERKKIGGFLTGEFSERSKKFTEELVERLGRESFHDGLKLSEWIYEGVSVWGISRAPLEAFLRKHLAKQLLYEEIIKSELPDLVIPVGFSGKKHPYSAAVFLKIARTMGIRVLEIENSFQSQIMKFFSRFTLRPETKRSLFQERLPEIGGSAESPEIFIVGCTSLSEIERMVSVLGRGNSRAIKIFLFEKMPLNLSRLEKILEGGKAKALLMSPGKSPDKKIKEFGFLLKRFHRQFYGSSVAVSSEWRWIGAQFEDSLKHIKSLKQIIALRPSLIVLQDENSIIRRVAAQLAQRAGIPTLYMPSYVEQLSGFFCKQDSSGSSGGIWAVSGRKVREKLIDAGVSPDRIAVTGLPGYKSFSNPREGAGPETERGFLNTLLWTTQGFPEEEQLLDVMCEWLKKMPHLRLLIKKHPRYSKQKMPPIDLKNVQIVEAGSVQSLIASSDMMITGSRSITAFEAIIQDKPVLIFNPYGRSAVYPFVDAGAALEAVRPEEISAKIEQILTDKALQFDLNLGREKIMADYMPPPGVFPDEEIAGLVDGGQWIHR